MCWWGFPELRSWSVLKSPSVWLTIGVDWECVCEYKVRITPNPRSHGAEIRVSPSLLLYLPPSFSLYLPLSLCFLWSLSSAPPLHPFAGMATAPPFLPRFCIPSLAPFFLTQFCLLSLLSLSSLVPQVLLFSETAFVIQPPPFDTDRTNPKSCFIRKKFFKCQYELKKWLELETTYWTCARSTFLSRSTRKPTLLRLFKALSCMFKDTIC